MFLDETDNGNKLKTGENNLGHHQHQKSLEKAQKGQSSAKDLGEISASHICYLYSHLEDISRFNTKHQTIKLGSEHETGPDDDCEKRLMATTEHLGRSPASQKRGKTRWGVIKHFLKPLKWGGLTIQMLRRCTPTSVLQCCCANTTPAPERFCSSLQTLNSELPHALAITHLSICPKWMKTYTDTQPGLRLKLQEGWVRRDWEGWPLYLRYGGS